MPVPADDLNNLHAGPPSGARMAVISDIHACREALIATLDDIREKGITDIICLGDVVGYGPDPGECFELVRSRCRYFVRGNHEVMLLAGDSSQWADEVRIPLAEARRQLPSGAIEEIRSWPLLIREPFWEAVHAGLDKPEAYRHLRTPKDFQNHFACQTRPVCFYGHTHKPGIHFRPEPRRILQAPAAGSFDLNRPGRFAIGTGSVAYPRDQSTTASWVSFDPDARTITFHQTAYDWETASRRLQEFLASHLSSGG